MRRWLRGAALLSVVVVAGAACRVEFGAREDGGGVASEATVHVYASMYKEVIDAVGPTLEKHLAETSPGTKVEWFQSGSEKIAARLDAELAAGGSPADILLVSDPSYYARLQAKGMLVPYVSPAVLRQPREFVDRDGYWATARISTMVIGVTAARAAKPDAPKSFADLAKPEAGRVTMPDPLSSGTTFTTVAQLSARLGWDYFRALKKKGTVAAGGNSSVAQRLDTGEADAGILLLENVLLGKKRGSHVELVLPSDSPVLIPGQIALLPHAKRSAAARAVYDALLTDDVQRIIVEVGVMHSPDPLMPPPAGMPPLDELIEMQPKVKVTETPETVKATFDQIFFR
jgi:iron(III) transport system substrate-binding protein